MKTTTRFVSGLGFSAAALLGTMTFAGAALIISDDFSGTGALNGVAADIGGNWVANGVDAAGFVPTQGASAYQAFTPTAGNVYTLSADFNVTTGDGNWMALGFVSGPFDPAPIIFRGETSAWLMKRGDGDSQLFSAGPSFIANAPTVGGSANLGMVLDTTGASWTVDYRINGTSVGNYTFGSIPAITAVGFGSHADGTGTVDNFQLDAVPEPTSALLGSLGALGMLIRRRR